VAAPRWPAVASWVTPATAVIAGVLVTLLLPLTFPADGGPTGFDHAVGDPLHRAAGAHREVFRAMVITNRAYVVIPVLLLVVLWYSWRRDWWSAGFLLIAPELVVTFNTWVLKPMWGRHLGAYYGYPSGHTVEFIGVVTGFVLVSATVRARIVAITVGTVVMVVSGAGMIGRGYHYPTDVLGGIAAAIALVTLCHVLTQAARVIGTRNEPTVSRRGREKVQAGL
jgi:undecaprenyl-diphosphatase